MKEKKVYQSPMEPRPGLEAFGRKIKILDQDLELFAYEAGRRHHTKLVLLHGLGDEADTWCHVIGPLSKDFHILAIDLPGFGRSDLPDGKITPAFLLNTLTNVLYTCGFKETLLIGNSLGGVLSHAYGLKFPDRITGLCLVGGALLQLEPMGDFGLRLMQIPLLGEWLYTRLRKDPQAAYNSLRNVYHDLDQMPEDDRGFLFQRVNKRVWSDNQRKAYFSTLRNLGPWIRKYQADLPGQLENFYTPTLILRGETDRLFSEENAKGVAELQPKASYSCVAGAGHLPHQEKPIEFLEVLRNWLMKIIS
jgi:pimeloyl-ACP methyl ester carboxylesterase